MILPISAAALLSEMENIGAHPLSWPVFQERAAIRPLKLFKVRTPAANILKQELLGLGADCALHRDCVSGQVPYTDVLLLGTVRAYRELLRKLVPMTFFGLPALSAELKNYLEQQPPRTVLADGRALDYGRLLIMGIINLTPDSFYAPSRYAGAAAVAAAGRMLEDGADIIDLGAESTRPGAEPVSPDMELNRLLPVIAGIRKQYPRSVISVDSYHHTVIKAALAEGADIINDITGGEDKEIAALASAGGAPLIVTHMQGRPRNMQDAPRYTDVVKEVAEFFCRRGAALAEAGIGEDKIIIDPGIGFGKTTRHNLELLRRLGEFRALGFPLLLAASRKQVIADVLGEGTDRLTGTLALSCQAAAAGAHIVRVHDVRENLAAIRMLEAVWR